MIDPTESAFRAAILAAPADDLPRLVYADWLEEHGRGWRATTIRAGCRLAECMATPGRPTGGMELAGWLAGQHRNTAFFAAFLETGPCDCEKCLRKRIEDAAEDYTAELTEEFGAGWWDEGSCGWGWPWSDRLSLIARQGWAERGFLARLACPAEWWVEHGDAVRALHPIERVDLTTWPENDRDEHGRPHLWTDDSALMHKMLGRRWPGVAFTLSADVVPSRMPSPFVTLAPR